MKFKDLFVGVFLSSTQRKTSDKEIECIAIDGDVATFKMLRTDFIFKLNKKNFEMSLWEPFRNEIQQNKQKQAL